MKSSSSTPAQRGAFDEWVDAMREWHREIDVSLDPDVVLATKFSEVNPEIHFGHRRESSSTAPRPSTTASGSRAT